MEGVTKPHENEIVIDATVLTTLQGAYQQTLESIRRQEPPTQAKWIPYNTTDLAK